MTRSTVKSAFFFFFSYCQYAVVTQLHKGHETRTRKRNGSMIITLKFWPMLLRYWLVHVEKTRYGRFKKAEDKIWLGVSSSHVAWTRCSLFGIYIYVLLTHPWELLAPINTFFIASNVSQCSSSQNTTLHTQQDSFHLVTTAVTSNHVHDHPQNVQMWSWDPAILPEEKLQECRCWWKLHRI